MRIYLVNPRFPESIWGFNRSQGLTGTRYSFAPLALPTVAALTPPEHEVILCDENVREIDFDLDCDVVGITAFNTQSARAFEIAAAFRERGVRVALGGPYTTLCPEECSPHADHLFVGEAEHTWPRFLEDLEAGRPRQEYRQEGYVPLAHSPTPRYDLLELRRYQAIPLQTSRGCPYDCEFCDVPITSGRRPRSKSPAQVLAEVEVLYRLGVRSVIFTDDNFTGNRKNAKEILRALCSFNESRGRPMTYRGEMTLNVAHDEELLDLLHEARFESVYVGVESPREECLAGAGKAQNTRRPMLEDIRAIQRRGIVVWAGMIVGFDQDDPLIFREQFDFLMEANVPVTTSGLLLALPKTRLALRLAREGRLLPWNKKETQGHLGAVTNIVPLQMTMDQLQAGYNWLIRSLYSKRNYMERLLGNLRNFPPPTGEWEWRLPTRKDLVATFRDLRTAWRVLRDYLWGENRELRGLFLRVVGRAIGQGRAAINQAFAYLVIYKHLYGFVRDNFGDPETVPVLDPFHALRREQKAAAEAASRR